LTSGFARTENGNFGFGHFCLDFGRCRATGESLELVGDADRLNDEEIVGVVMSGTVTAPPTLTERFNLALIAQIVLDVALHGLAAGQARSDERFKLDNVRVGEFESVEWCTQYFGGAIESIDRSHNVLIGGTAEGIDQKDFAIVSAVGCNQFTHENRIRRICFLNFKEQTERVADLSRVDVASIACSDPNETKSRTI